MPTEITEIIPLLPTPPTRTDAVSFDTRADAFMAALPGLGASLNRWAGQANVVGQVVDGYLNDVSSVYRLYVDSLAGSDANNGRSTTTPFATLDAALALLSLGLSRITAEVYLACDGAYTLGLNERVMVGDVMLSGWDAPATTAYPTRGTLAGGALPTITQPSSLREGATASMPAMVVRGGQVQCFKVSLRTAASIPSGATATAMFRTEKSGARFGLQLHTCAVSIRATSLVEILRAFCCLCVYASDIGVTSGIAMVSITNGTLALSVSGSTIPIGSRWPDTLITGLARNGGSTVDPRNAISNIALTY